jgi:5-methylcytosine-specific restriction protein A
MAGGLFRPCTVCGIKVDARVAEARCPKHRRPSARTRGYDRSWQRKRDAFLAAHRWCERCFAEGRGHIPARQVDHILAKRDRGTDDDANLRSLCASCHSRRTAIDHSGWRDESR